LDVIKCFPTDSIAEEFIDRAQQFSVKKVRSLLRRFLINSRTRPIDQNTLEAYHVLDSPGLHKERFFETEFYRRLASENYDAWEGITWVLDLLPTSPKMAIEVIKSYISAHIMLLHDYELIGLEDAMTIVRARFINHQQPRDIFLDLHPREFEILIDALYDKMGYDTTLTPYRNDGGKDVIAISSELGKEEKLLIECKRYEPDVGPDIIRALNGVVSSDKATKGVLVTSSDFTPEARNFAKENGVELINHSNLTRLLNTYFGTNWPSFVDRIILTRKFETSED